MTAFLSNDKARTPRISS
ncbi:hypothetical protein R3I93_004850 [Phoxinus phoxinus]|uniref:Uncharacterized protein n=1 Tax=Phoxinus phoxinus TaxID=58324 RepID=A0AAN9DEN7_9TELE